MNQIVDPQQLKRDKDLFLAVSMGNERVAMHLLAEGANPAGGVDGMLPFRTFHMAAEKCSSAMLHEMVRCGADPLAANGNGQNALAVANAENVRTLVEMGVPVEGREDGGRTPLMTVCHNVWRTRADCVGRARALLQVGADPNTLDDKNKSPLMYLFSNAGGDKTAMIEVLVAAGADIYHRDRFGQSVLVHACVIKPDVQAVKRLVELGARFDPRSGQLECAVESAIQEDQVHALQRLKQYGWQPHDDGGRWLHHAYRSDAPSSMTWLVEQGVPVHAVDDKGKTLGQLRVKPANCMRVLKSLLAQRAALQALEAASLARP